MAARWSCLDCGWKHYDYVDGVVYCQNCGFEEWWRDWKHRSDPTKQQQRKPPPSAPPPPDLKKFLPDEQMKRRLIQLCHPDRHGNSKASVIATQWLLSLPDSPK